MGVIYLLLFPNGKCYVGQTRGTSAARVEAHRQRAKGARRTHGAGAALYAAIRKHGMPEVFELQHVAAGELDRHEMDWIAAFGTLAPHGYNMTAGGDANPMHSAAGRASFNAAVRSAPRRAAISAALRVRERKPLTPEQRGRISRAKRGAPSTKRGAAFVARQAGQTHYVAAPCARCGGTLRYAANHSCCNCERAGLRKRRAAR